MNRTELLNLLLGTNPETCYRRSDAPYRLLQLQGPDAGDFLQRLSSQEVLELPPLVVRPLAFLDAKGKLLATGLVFRRDDCYWIETPTEQAERLHKLLERYHFSERLQIQALPATPVAETIWRAAPDLLPQAALAGDQVQLTMVRNGIAARRQHGPAAALQQDAAVADSQPLPPELAECLRMAAGLVRVGVESEPTTLLLETGLDDHYSLTKGCYTGQEIVARIHTYGHTNRRLCLLQLAAGPDLVAAEQLLEPVDQLAVGRVLHAAQLPGGLGRLGVGYLPKDFQAAQTRLQLADGSAVVVLGDWQEGD